MDEEIKPVVCIPNGDKLLLTVNDTLYSFVVWEENVVTLDPKVLLLHMSLIFILIN